MSNSSTVHDIRSRASSVSSKISTPVSSRRKSIQNANTTSQSTTTSGLISSPRTVRRLQSKSKTVRWRQTSYKDNSNDPVDTNETTLSQQQHQTTTNDVISMMSDESDIDLTPSAIIDTLSLSNSNDADNIDNHGNNEISIRNSSLEISDMEDNIDNLTNNDRSTTLNQNKTGAMVQLTELLQWFEQSQDGSAYICKKCHTVIYILSMFFK